MTWVRGHQRRPPNTPLDHPKTVPVSPYDREQGYGTPPGYDSPPGYWVSDKDYMTALLLSIFLGSLGVDRFYLGYTSLGFLKLITMGGCGLWILYDILLIGINKLPDANGLPLRR